MRRPITILILVVAATLGGCTDAAARRQAIGDQAVANAQRQAQIQEANRQRFAQMVPPAAEPAPMSPAAPAFVTSTGQPLEPPRDPFQDRIDGAIERFCASATGTACALFRQDAERCRIDSGNAISVITSMRFWRKEGLTQRQAAERSSLPEWHPIAEAAWRAPDTLSPRGFGYGVLDECLQFVSR